MLKFIYYGHYVKSRKFNINREYLQKNHAYKKVWYIKISQIIPNYRYVDVTTTLVKLQMSTALPIYMPIRLLRQVEELR